MAKVTINESTLTSIADAIREKTSTSDRIQAIDMADMILSIEGGGGSGTLPMTYGSFTPTEKIDCENYPEIKHGLQKKPDVMILYAEEQYPDNGCFWYFIFGKGFARCNYSNWGNYATKDIAYTLTDEGLKITGLGSSISFIAGKTYNWIAIGGSE